MDLGGTNVWGRACRRRGERRSPSQLHSRDEQVESRSLRLDLLTELFQEIQHRLPILRSARLQATRRPNEPVVHLLVILERMRPGVPLYPDLVRWIAELQPRFLEKILEEGRPWSARLSRHVVLVREDVVVR